MSLLTPLAHRLSQGWPQDGGMWTVMLGLGLAAYLIRCWDRKESERFMRWTESLAERRARGEILDHKGDPEPELSVRVVAFVDEPADPVDRARLERAINGALRSAIQAHGPITKDWIGSATKRVIGALSEFRTRPIR